MKRLFIATPITLSTAYDGLLKGLHQHTAYDKITWEKSNLQHLTIKFLGETPDQKIPPLKEALKEIASETPCFDMKIKDLGIFGSSYHPKILRFGFEKQPIINQLFEVTENKLVNELEFRANDGNFVPHITLGRIKDIDSKKRFWEMIEKFQPTYFQEFKIEKIVLFRSRLEKDGPIYTVMDEFKLNNEL